MVGLMLAILSWGPLALGAVRATEFLVLQGLTCLVLALWLARFWLNPGLRLNWPPAAWAVLALMGYAGVRYCFADVEYVARQEVVRIQVFGALFLASLSHLHRPQRLRVTVGLLLLLGTAEAGLAIYQFITHPPTIWGCLRPENYLDRASGTYINPNHLAGFLEMILPLATAWAVASRASLLSRILAGYAALAMAAGLVMTGSRAGWLAATLGLLWLVVLLLRTPRQWLGLVVMVAMLIGAGLLIYSRSLTLQFRVQALSRSLTTIKNNVRFLYADAAYRMWKDHPWFGVGPDHYDLRFRNYRAETWIVAAGRPGRAHNDYLNVLADWGLIGGVLAMLPVGCVAWSVVRRRRQLGRGTLDSPRETSQDFFLLAGASAGVVAILAHSTCDFNLHIPANAILAVTLLALISGHLCHATGHCRFPVTTGIRLAATVLLLLGLLGFGFQGRRRALEERWLASARGRPTLSQARIDALKRAFAIEPRNAETALSIGEEYRGRSWAGRADHSEQGEQAIAWFRQAATLNPYDPLSPMEWGACLDWLGRHAEAEPLFRKALALDPNGYRVRAMMGWHYLQVEDYERALEWFDKSLRMNSYANPQARAYRSITLEKLAEKKKAGGGK